MKPQCVRENLKHDYSLAYASGHLNDPDPESPWAYACISQTGLIPAANGFAMKMLSLPAGREELPILVSFRQKGCEDFRSRAIEPWGRMRSS